MGMKFGREKVQLEKRALGDLIVLLTCHRDASCPAIPLRGASSLEAPRVLSYSAI